MESKFYKRPFYFNVTSRLNNISIKLGFFYSFTITAHEWCYPPSQYGEGELSGDCNQCAVKITNFAII